jgi:hypothetical protein
MVQYGATPVIVEYCIEDPIREYPLLLCKQLYLAIFCDIDPKQILNVSPLTNPKMTRLL